MVLVVKKKKNLPPNAGDTRDAGSVSGSGRSPGGGHGNSPRYSCLENPMDRGAWQVIVHTVAKSQTWLKWLSTAHTSDTLGREYEALKCILPTTNQSICIYWLGGIDKKIRWALSGVLPVSRIRAHAGRHMTCIWAYERLVKIHPR